MQHVELWLCFVYVQEYQVRILDADKCEATQRLQQGCATLSSKVEQLNGLVKTYLEILDKQAGPVYKNYVSSALRKLLTAFCQEAVEV